MVKINYSQARPILNGGKFAQILDPSLGSSYDCDLMERMMLAATLCIRRSPRARPHMSLVSPLKLLLVINSDCDVLIMQVCTKILWNVGEELISFHGYDNVTCIVRPYMKEYTITTPSIPKLKIHFKN